MDISRIKLSKEFKNQTTKAILSIVLFFLVYLAISALAVVLTILCVIGGVLLIEFWPGLLTIVFGFGLASLGLLILIFLIKFIFKSHKIDRSDLVEIKESDEPELFQLIKEIVSEVGTKFPKKVYLSHDVNAAVFYNSSFWSMIFPVRKNLLIGMGLINTVSIVELKAILAHEFGHFSQRTMKVGSYVYNVNHVIYNLLFENDSFGNLVQKWASISGYVFIFVRIAVEIIKCIQWILQKMYNVVNINYLGLSREMEFHADEVAACITGPTALRDSLLRLNLAEHSYHSVMKFYESKFDENLKSENIYKNQFFVMNFLAKENEMYFKNDLPIVSIDELNKFNKSKLVIKDQWASHPSIEERIKRLDKKFKPNAESKDSPCIYSFNNIDSLQIKLNNQFFSTVKFTGDIKNLSNGDFEKKYLDNYQSNTFDKVYNGYYDDKNPSHFELDKISSNYNLKNSNDLFSDKKIDLVYTSIALKSDIELLKQISNKEYPINSYDYDGKRYKRKESSQLIEKLKAELAAINEDIRKNDLEIYLHFKSTENSEGDVSKLDELYADFMKIDSEYENKLKPYFKLNEAAQFLNFVTPVEEIESNFLRIRIIEKELKLGITELMEDNNCLAEMKDIVKENFTKYLSKDWEYFGNENYYDENLHILFNASNDFYVLVSNAHFMAKKNLLDYQAKLIKDESLIGKDF